MKTDEQLFADYVAGDETGLVEIKSRYHEWLVGYVRRSGVQGAEDIVQAIFAYVVSNRDYFIQGKSIRPWLYSIADELIGIPADA